MAYRLSGKVLAFVRTQRVARLATVGSDRTPHNVAVCTVCVDGRIYIASEKNARKVRNLGRNPRVALAFDQYSEDWKRLAGVMVVGTCTTVDRGVAFQRARRALYRKYRQYARLAPVEEGESVIVCVKPTSSFAWGL